jgi:hypothetical protein
MKHPQYQRHRKYGVEWLQAFFTLMVLVWIYMSMPYFDSYETTLAEPVNTTPVSRSYWNDELGYGFNTGSGDTYNQVSTGVDDKVDIRSSSGIVYDGDGVRVSFYSQATIDDIQQYHREDTPRTYSRLPNGIAVIEWDLASPTAKTVLATLHSR